MKNLKTLLITLATGVLLFSVTSVPASAATNGKIVFTVTDGLSFNVGSVDSDGSNYQVLTDNNSSSYPSITSNGQTILFAQPEEEGLWPMYTMNSDGTNVIDIGVSGFYGSIFSNTKMTFFNDSFVVHTVDLDGSAPVSTGHTPTFEGWLGSPSFSQADKFAYVSADDEDGEGPAGVSVADLDGSNSVKVNSTLFGGGPAIAADGSKVYYLGTDDVESFYVYSVNSDGTNEQQVLELPGLPYAQRLSPDGSKLVLLVGDETNAIGAYTINVDGTNLTQILDIEYGDEDGIMSINWSPDSTKLVFSQDNGEQEDLYTVNADGTGLTNITNTPDVDELIVYTDHAWGAATSSSSNTATLTSLNGTEITIETPSGTTITCSSVSEEASASSDDTNYTYPLGLVNFCFDTEDEDNAVTLTFITDLKPNEVTPRKYSPNTKTYTTLTEASVTETEVEGQHALAVTYTITDNGDLDLNPEEGSIEDPVGLATTADSLASTGQNTAMVLSAAILLSFVGLSIATITMRNKSV